MNREKYSIKYKEVCVNTLQFYQMQGGECFKLTEGASIYLKLSHAVDIFNAVNLLSGFPIKISPDFKVIPVKTTLTENKE